MLTHNAQNLASKTEEVLHYIDIASVTGKVPPNVEMLSYGMQIVICSRKYAQAACIPS